MINTGSTILVDNIRVENWGNVKKVKGTQLMWLGCFRMPTVHYIPSVTGISTHSIRSFTRGVPVVYNECYDINFMYSMTWHTRRCPWHYVTNTWLYDVIDDALLTLRLRSCCRQGIHRFPIVKCCLWWMKKQCCKNKNHKFPLL